MISPSSPFVCPLPQLRASRGTTTQTLASIADFSPPARPPPIGGLFRHHNHTVIQPVPAVGGTEIIIGLGRQANNKTVSPPRIIIIFESPKFSGTTYRTVYRHVGSAGVLFGSQHVVQKTNDKNTYSKYILNKYFK
jgi:hypothetical protein